MKKDILKHITPKIKKEALAKAIELINKEDIISWGGSVTTREIGLINYLEENNFKTINRDKATSKEEKDELDLDIEKNITEQTVEEVKQEDNFELEAEPVNSVNKELGDSDGN